MVGAEDIVGGIVGREVGDSEGISVGTRVGPADCSAGDAVGVRVVTLVGFCVDAKVEAPVGLGLGPFFGTKERVGVLDDSSVGPGLGIVSGSTGILLGTAEGANVS